VYHRKVGNASPDKDHQIASRLLEDVPRACCDEDSRDDGADTGEACGRYNGFTRIDVRKHCEKVKSPAPDGLPLRGQVCQLPRTSYATLLSKATGTTHNAHISTAILRAFK
jgi:hypothetical protein